MKKVLLISNVKLETEDEDEPEEIKGRTEKFLTRNRLLEEHGWEITNCYIPSGKSPSSLLRCLRTAVGGDFDVINSVSEPFYLHMIGYLVSRLTSTPWLAEFRDPMVVNKPNLDEKPVEKKIRKMVEPFILKKADQVVWDDGIQIPDNYFSETYPNPPEDKWFKIPYIGFEKEKFEEAPSKLYDKFTITYAGSFYDGWIEPKEFIRGLSRYLSEYDDPEIQVQFYGDWKNEYTKQAVNEGVWDIISTHEWVPHDELIPILKGSDILLHIGGVDPRNRINIPTKVYDYIGAKTPILALVDPSFRVADVIEDNQLGFVVNPNTTEKIPHAIDTLRTGKFQYWSSEDVINKFSREYRVKVLAEVLDSVSKGERYHPTEDNNK